MINVNELKRNAKNIVKKYSDAQVKVREATSNDAWGPSSTIMAEIADLTYNVVAFSEIMQMIWKRLNDHGKNWRHVFKSLVLLEYLIKTGNDKVAQQCIENIFAIQTLKDFQYVEENKDHGSSIREKSKKLVALLKDPERLAAERARALKAKARLVEAVSSSGQSSGSFDRSSSINRSSNVSGGDLGGHNGSGVSSSGMLGSNNNYQFVEADSSSGLGSDIDSARPHSLTEEETQLQIALALSKEEAERQEKTRKNDELRLKLALDASKQAAATANSSNSIVSANDLMDEFTGSSSSMTSGPSQQSSHDQTSSKFNKQSNIDDLLGLSFQPAESSASLDSQRQQQQVTSTVPNGLFSSTLASSSSVASPPKLAPQNDPWSVDPWQTVTVPTSAPSTFMNSNVISNQQCGFAPQPTLTFPAVSPSIANTLPSVQPPANSITTTLVPNQFPISSLDSIFSPTATPSTASTANQPQGRKTLSKNPFED